MVSLLTIDCTTCPVRGRHCGDCFVPVLARDWVEEEPTGDGTLPLDPAELAAVAAFVRTGLVPAATVVGLRALPAERASAAG